MKHKKQPDYIFNFYENQVIDTKKARHIQSRLKTSFFIRVLGMQRTVCVKISQSLTPLVQIQERLFR